MRESKAGKDDRKDGQEKIDEFQGSNRFPGLSGLRKHKSERGTITASEAMNTCDVVNAVTSVLQAATCGLSDRHATARSRRA